MMAFQHEPQPTKCDRCHEAVPPIPKLTSESEPYCSRCGFVFGTSVAPSSWVCEDCAEIVLDHGGDNRPWCENCKVPMSCCHAAASGVHGTGLGADLDYGFAFLCEAQGLLDLGSNIINDMTAGLGPVL